MDFNTKGTNSTESPVVHGFKMQQIERMIMNSNPVLTFLPSLVILTIAVLACGCTTLSDSNTSGKKTTVQPAPKELPPIGVWYRNESGIMERRIPNGTIDGEVIVQRDGPFNLPIPSPASRLLGAVDGPRLLPGQRVVPLDRYVERGRSDGVVMQPSSPSYSPRIEPLPDPSPSRPVETERYTPDGKLIVDTIPLGKSPDGGYIERIEPQAPTPVIEPYDAGGDLAGPTDTDTSGTAVAEFENPPPPPPPPPPPEANTLDVARTKWASNRTAGDFRMLADLLEPKNLSPAEDVRSFMYNQFGSPDKSGRFSFSYTVEGGQVATIQFDPSNTARAWPLFNVQ